MAKWCRENGSPTYKTHKVVKVANGEKVHIREEIAFFAQVTDSLVFFRCAVLPDLTCDVLLGIDAQRTMGMTLRIGQQEWDPRLDAVTVDSPPGLRSCTEEQRKKLEAFLVEELGRFDLLTGLTHMAKHRIRLKTGAEPIKHRYTPKNPVTQAIIDEEVSRMLAEGIIEPSNSPWSSPVVVVKKKNGKRRFCIDFRRVNEVTEKDAYPLPQVQATLEKLRGAKYISTIDLTNGYWQIPLDHESRPITAFTVPGRGLFQFRRMPFGLHSAPATFQRLLDQIIGPQLEPRAFAYLDDIIVLGSTFEEHFDNLREVLQRLRAAGLKLNKEKCQFGRTELQYLGHTVTERGVATDPEKVQAIARIPAPTNLRELRRFLGMVSWYRRFIPRFTDIAAPLNHLLQKKVRWTWSEKEEIAFETLRQQLATAPVLACPDFTLPFTLQTDASNEGLGAVLTQDINSQERVIAYASRTLNSAEKNYSVTEKECLAVVWGIRKMRPYLEGYRFTVLTDHQSLKWLRTMDNPSGRLARWGLELQEYDFDIQYRKGANNLVADALSRRPEGSPQDEVNSMEAPTDCPWYDRIKAAAESEPHRYPEYHVVDGRLYRHISDTHGPRSELEWKLCVPRPLREAVLRENHDAPTAGHLGGSKTAARLAQRYFWPGMVRDAKRYVSRCQKCLEYKALQQAPAGGMQTTPAANPWDVVAVDLVGPLPRSAKGFTMLAVMQDKFSKWVEIQPLRQATAPAVTKAFKERIALRFGCPRRVITDNGRQYESKEFTSMLRTYGIEHRRTPPYTPQCNPVERVNRVIKTMIAQLTNGDHRHWDHWLPEIMFAFNTARHDSTGYTPAYLNYGREPAAPGAIRQSTTGITDDTEDQRTNRTEELERLHEAIRLARHAQAQATETQKKAYNLRRRDWRPQIGEKVIRGQKF